MDMEPSRNIMGCRDISDIQNSLQLKLEVKKWFLKSIFLFSESVNLNIDRLGRSMHNDYDYCFLVKKLLFCCLKMEGVGVYAATIHDKNANSFKLSHDRFPSYLILFHSTNLV